MTYQHKQPGFIIISVILIGIFFLVDLMRMTNIFWHDIIPPYVIPLLIAVCLLAISSGVLFTSLTIGIDEERLIWHFAFGFWKKRVELAHISSTQSVSNRWWYGWGIKHIPGGWLYNVSGMRAVEVRLTNGRMFRLGTDEPEQLVAAIKSAKEKL